MTRNVMCIVCYILLEVMPMNMMLDEHNVKFVKSCLNGSEVISLYARIRSTDNSFLDICHVYDVHCELSNDRVSHNFTS